MDVKAKAADRAARDRFMMVSPRAAAVCAPLAGNLITPEISVTRSAPTRGRLPLDVGFRPVIARSGLRVPSSVGGFVLDRLGAARHPLLGGCAPCGCQRRGAVRKRLGKHAVDRIGPAAVMFDDLVGHMGHRELAVYMGPTG